MKLTEMSREQFDERLGSRSEADLAKMAKGYKLDAPAGMNKAALLDLLFDGLKAQDSASATGGSLPKGASPDPVVTPPVAAPRFSVLCATRHKQFWKFGFCFTHEWQDLPESKFTAEQWAYLRDKKKCPHVRVKDLQVVVAAPAE